MSRMNKKSIESFQERVNKIVEKLNISEDQKKCILNLLEIEMKRPTFEKTFMDRYSSIISIDGGIDI